MKKKNLISLFVASIFLTLGISGLLMYFAFREPGVKTTHILFGLLFIGIAVFHIINNWSSLVSYTIQRSNGKIQKEFLVSAGIIGIILLGTALNFEPLAELAHFGEELGRGERQPVQHLMFEEVTTNQQINGLALDIILQNQPEVALPNTVIWIANENGMFLQNLFVPAKEIRLLEEGEDVRHILDEGEYEYENLHPEQFFYWNMRAETKVSNYEQATPTEHLYLHTNASVAPPFQVMVEIGHEGKKELYSATIDPTLSGAFKLKGEGNTTLLANGLVEIR